MERLVQASIAAANAATSAAVAVSVVAGSQQGQGQGGLPQQQHLVPQAMVQAVGSGSGRGDRI
ncbi:hypothetical protein HDU76_004812 [Blyttiomyces sp. JEL0837]|nr:hypothetical protein HDU76_004812 [Blyttiomyces sp. JEL0837]